MDEGIKTVGNLMKLAARTAPKAVGQDYIAVRFLFGAEKDIVAREMDEIAKETGDSGFTRDAGNLKSAQACLLVGLKDHQGIGLNCGGCGYETCSDMNAARKKDGGMRGPNCMLRLTDFGIALGSAARVASAHHVDNRIMYRVGVAARRINLLECNIVMGVPLSAKGKNIFFDR